MPAKKRRRIRETRSLLIAEFDLANPRHVKALKGLSKLLEEIKTSEEKERP